MIFSDVGLIEGILLSLLKTALAVMLPGYDSMSRRHVGSSLISRILLEIN